MSLKGSTKIDSKFMRRALDLAVRAQGRTSPNPMVGAVIVKGGRVVGEGYHREAGGPHAEVEALSAAGPRARSGVLYVTLEPCCHTEKRTPPCTRAIIQSGIRRVVIAMRDPNPRVAGRGAQQLRRAGIEVSVGILELPAGRLNEAYTKFITTGRPFVILKAAMTLDGKIALGDSLSRWITGEKARVEAHRLRDRVDAVLVGIGTVLSDDPKLTARLPGGRGRDPHRVIVDSTLRLPVTAHVLARTPSVKTIVATTKKAPADRIRRLEETGAAVWVLSDEEGKVGLGDLTAELGRRGITSLMIEGGAEINRSALRAGIVDKLVWFLAPSVAGGADAISVFGKGPSSKLQEPVLVRDLRCRRVGEDLMVEGYLEKGPS